MFYKKNTMKVKVYKEGKHELPMFATDGSAACDVPMELSLWDNKFSNKLHKASLWDLDENPILDSEKYSLVNSIKIMPHGRALIPTGLYCDIPKGWCFYGKERSGYSINTGYTIHLGLIDNDYKGQIGIIIKNETDRVIEFKDGDKPMQLIFTKQYQFQWEQVDSKDFLTKSNRGENGYGHTGK